MERRLPMPDEPSGSATTCRISAVLLSWKRPWHIPVIANHLRQFPQIHEIICWCNEFEPTPEIRAAVDVAHWSRTNEGTFGRFLAQQFATCGNLLVQDDDLLVHNIPELAERYFALGRQRIVANLAQDRSSRHWSWWQARHPPWVELGFGSIVPKEFCGVLSDWPYDAELRRRKADKILTVLKPWEAVRAGPEAITRLYHNDQESGRDEHALSRKQDHERLTREAVRLAAEWKAQLADDARTGSRACCFLDRAAVGRGGDCGRGG